MGCQAMLDDAEANALKGGKKAMNKMETRIRELESEVDAEQRRMGDATKNLPSLRDASRRCLMLLMKTGRTKNACRSLLMTCKTRSSLTRSKLRRLKKLPPSTWPNSATPKLKFLTLLNLPI